jgi:hypothetical protein
MDTWRKSVWRNLACTGCVALSLAGACSQGKGPQRAAKVTTTTTSSTSTSTSTSTLGATSGSTSTLLGTATTPPQRGAGTVPTTTTMQPAETPIDANDIRDRERLGYTFGSTRMNGVSYPSALVLQPDQYTRGLGRLEIDAGRAHTRFLGDLGIPDTEHSSTAYKVEISLDDAAPVFSTEVRFGETKSIDLDVTRVLRIKIFVSPIACCDDVAIGNPRFSR